MEDAEKSGTISEILDDPEASGHFESSALASSTLAFSAPFLITSMACSQSRLSLYPWPEVAMTWPLVALSRQRCSSPLSS